MPNFQSADPERPRVPSWLPTSAQQIFSDLVEDLIAASVPLKKVDGHAVAMAALNLDGVSKWAVAESKAKKAEARQEAAAMVARFSRDGLQWLTAICGSPQARARIGLRVSKPTVSKSLAIIEAMQRRKA